MLACAISGVVPSDPVFVPKTGLLYSKRLLEHALKAEGKCPVTQLPIAADDICAVRTEVEGAAPPRVPETSSVPSLLKLLQTEWDASSLETFKLRQTLDKTRKELAQALYQQDAAQRVIAKLIQERDQARAALSGASLPAHVSNNGGATKTETSVAFTSAPAARDLSPEEEVSIRDLAKSLSSARKKRKATAKTESVESWSCTTIQLPVAEGVCIDLDDDQGIIAVGSRKDVTLVNAQDRKVKETISFNAAVSKAVILNSKQTQGGKLMVATGQSVMVHGHAGVAELVLSSLASSCAAHASGEFGFASETAGFLTLFRLGTGQIARSMRADKGPMTCLDAHPDGLLVATGGESDGVVQVWDILSKQAAAQLREHTGHVSALSFSENGTKLVSVSARDMTVKVWDLRNTAKPLISIKGPNKSVAPVDADFDPAGNLLVIGYADGALQVSQVAKDEEAWPVVLTASAGRPLAGLRFGSGSIVAVNDQASIARWTA